MFASTKFCPKYQTLVPTKNSHFKVYAFSTTLLLTCSSNSDNLNGCIVSVRGQGLMLCRASANCTGAPGDEVGEAVDGRGCCLNNPRALAFSDDGGSCVPCVGECT